MWNVNTETLADGDRTSNLAETWNKTFAVLVGHSHPSVLVTVEAFQADLALAECSAATAGEKSQTQHSAAAEAFALTLRGSPRRSQVRGRDSAKPWSLHSVGSVGPKMF